MGALRPIFDWEGHISNGHCAAVFGSGPKLFDYHWPQWWVVPPPLLNKKSTDWISKMVRINTLKWKILSFYALLHMDWKKWKCLADTLDLSLAPLLHFNCRWTYNWQGMANGTDGRLATLSINWQKFAFLFPIDYWKGIPHICLRANQINFYPTLHFSRIAS